MLSASVLPFESGVTSGSPLICLRAVCKTYPAPGVPYRALSDIDLELFERQFVAIVGKSGSGKSTLANVITGIDRPSSGEVVVAGTPLHQLSQDRLARWRGRTVGVVFQFFQLLPSLTAAENVMLPMELCGTFGGRRTRRARELLERVDIGAQADKLPAALSGGEQQRAAIARALANDPPILVADEPTGNLDSHTTEAVLRFFSGLAAEGKTILLVTHERDVMSYVTRTITLADGAIIAGAGASDGAGSRAVEEVSYV